MLADHVLYIDSEALIVDKPAGLPVDPPRDGALSVQNHLVALMLGYREWPLPVHRLDRDTSGCLMLGRSAKAHKRLALAFEAGLVAKRYLAVLDGVPQGAMVGGAMVGEGGTIDLPLAKTSSAEAGWRIVPGAGLKGAKVARTAWTLIAIADGRALVELRPETGRTHQLRVHAASGLGLPIVGDAVYGAAHAGGLMLHAADLALERPGKPRIAAHAPFPPRFAALGFADPDAG